MSCLVRASARQKFNGDIGVSTRIFNDAMVRTRQFRSSVSGRMGTSIIHTNYRYILAQDKFSACKAEEWGVAVATSIDNNAADGNLDQRNVRSISVDYTSVLTHLSLNYSAKYIITPQDGWTKWCGDDIVE